MPVTVTVYVPAARLLKSSVLALFDQLKVKLPGMDTVMSTDPLNAVQEVFGMTADVRENGALLLRIVAEALAVQPFAPVTVTV